MKQKAKSIRPFIGAKNFEVSRNFYRELGFEEVVLAPNFSVFNWGNLSFYLQDYYTKDWIDNTMLFMEVEDTHAFYAMLSGLNLPDKFKGVKVLPVREMDWGRECFVHDPSGVLWHFGEFTY